MRVVASQETTVWGQRIVQTAKFRFKRGLLCTVSINRMHGSEAAMCARKWYDVTEFSRIVTVDDTFKGDSQRP